MFRYLKRGYRRRFGKDKEFCSAVRSMLGVTPDNIEIYKLAFVHRSASVPLPDGTLINNERLEFLGDAVLDAIVSDYLFVEYRGEAEGFLTQMRSRIVSRTTMDEVAQQLGFEEYLVANYNGAYSHKHLLGNALEAMIGALYLDKGYEVTNRIVINNILQNHVNFSDVAVNDSDYKSRLIEWCQKSKREIRFCTSHDKGSTMQQPRFVSTVIIDGIEIGHGSGTSKKEAEQKASYSVTQLISDEMGDFFLDKIDTSFESLINGTDLSVN